MSYAIAYTHEWPDTVAKWAHYREKIEIIQRSENFHPSNQPHPALQSGRHWFLYGIDKMGYGFIDDWGNLIWSSPEFTLESNSQPF